MKANILVIDDELTVCRSCQKILGDGYNVTTVLSGVEGLEKVRKEDFDLVIVDLKMPGMDGMQVVETVKKERPSVQVIIMTGYSTVQSAVTGMKLGAFDYISKPFTPEEMITAVEKALQRRRDEAKDEGLLINREAIIEVLRRASEDRDFAAGVADPFSDTLKDYNLSPEEKAALVSVIHPSEEETMLVVSHELKSPLSSIASLARAIKEPGVAGDQKEKFLDRIIARAETGLEMVEEYLALSAISAGELELSLQQVNLLEEVIQKALGDQQEAMNEKRMTAFVDVPGDLKVKCDPGYMKIVYNNLINNAVKYGTPGTEIHIGYLGLRNQYHHFCVANVGEWIAENDRRRIFEKYVTLGKRGTGIGLHAAMEIIKKHGGQIWVEPCYFARGKCIAARAVIEEAKAAEEPSSRLTRCNDFVFTLPVENRSQDDQ